MRNKSDAQIKLLAYAGLCTALVAVATMVIKIPVPITNGYVHLGDGIIFASAALLGPFAGVVAGIGSALADLLSGYGHYALITLVIKGAMGLISGYCLHSLFKNSRGRSPLYGNLLLRNLVLFALCELLMVIGYFFFEMVMYSAGEAVGAVLPNVLQGVFGVVIGCVLCPAVNRISKQIL